MLKYIDHIINILNNLKIKLTKIKIKQRLNNIKSNPSNQIWRYIGQKVLEMN